MNLFFVAVSKNKTPLLLAIFYIYIYIHLFSVAASKNKAPLLLAILYIYEILKT